MARPRKEIDKTDFEGLLAIQCTLEEVTAFFDHKLDGCSEDTIERWCKREYGESFAEISKKKREIGKISLRRLQFKHAEKNASMAIFLGKNYLGQKDNPGGDVDDVAKQVIEAVSKVLGEVESVIE